MRLFNPPPRAADRDAGLGHAQAAQSVRHTDTSERAGAEAPAEIAIPGGGLQAVRVELP